MDRAISFLKKNNFRNRNNLSCPPLTPSDILTVKGKPSLKVIKPYKKQNVLVEQAEQEWIYVILNPMKSKEHYFFKGGYLVNWKKTAL
ncbi:MAG: hypothetical protein HY811_03840 [Planctomycetes bacterium]|nr:hypothetical protein [Planctomycetota bacterium]